MILKQMSFNKKVLDEINKIRKDPNAYAEKLLWYKQYFKGNYLSLQGKPIETIEGYTVYEEAANQLKTTGPLPEFHHQKV